MSTASFPLPRYFEVFEKSWSSIKDNLGLVAALTLVYYLSNLSMAVFTIAGPLLSGWFFSGYLVCLIKIKNKETIGFKDFFWAF